MEYESANASGKTAFSKGKLKKPTNDGKFMAALATEDRDQKQELILAWKRGWDEAKAEVPVEEVEAVKPTKKAKKKAKKKVAKKIGKK